MDSPPLSKSASLQSAVISHLGCLSALHTQKGLPTQDWDLNTVEIANFGKATHIPSQWDFSESSVSVTCMECAAFPEVM